MKYRITLTPEAASVVKEMFANGELQDIGVLAVEESHRKSSASPLDRPKRTNLPSGKEEEMRLCGTIVKLLPDGEYLVSLGSGHQIIGWLDRQLTMDKISIKKGDEVRVVVSVADIHRGRIYAKL